MMNAYQQEQLEGQRLVQQNLQQLPTGILQRIIDQVSPYLDFRQRVDRFLERHCGQLCTKSCFESNTSACCSRDGIITFWADLVVNALESDLTQSQSLLDAIQGPLNARKCIYLGSHGCLWQVRPLVCAMFLCDEVKQDLFGAKPDLEGEWTDLTRLAKGYRWPDRPVLFDKLEKAFIDRGCQSELMYLNNSPGLLRLKKRAGIG